MADIITRKGKGANLTPLEVDSNFINLNNAILAIQGVYGSGTVSSVSTSYTAVNSVLTFAVTNSSTTPLITVAVTGSSGYVKSSGSALSVSATIPFTDTTGTVPPNRGGTGLTSIGSNQTLLGSDGSALVYRTLSSTDASIVFNWATSGVLKMVVDPSVIDINSLYNSLNIAKGGTGANTRQAALNNLANASGGTTGYGLVLNGSGNVVWGPLSTATGTVTSVSVSTTGVSSVLSFSIGGSATVNPTLNVSVTGSAGYLKSTGSAISSVAVQTAINELTNVSSASVYSMMYKDSSGNVSWTSNPYVSSATATGVMYAGSSKEIKTDTTHFKYNEDSRYSLLTVGEIIESKYKVVSSDATLDDFDSTVYLITSSTGSINLPSIGSGSIPYGKKITIKDVTGGLSEGNIWVIDGSGTTIDGSGEFTLNSPYQCLILECVDNGYGSKVWSVISNYKTT
jgi:hypothetical protein